MIYLLQADSAFFKKDYSKAHENYESGNKLIVRARASRGVDKDDIAYEMKTWECYSKGKLILCEALLAEKLDKKLTLLNEARRYFEEFYELRKNDEDRINAVLASLHMKLLNYYTGVAKAQKFKERLSLYKKHLLHARTDLATVHFFSRMFEEELDDLQNEIDDITKRRIVNRADWYWDKGSHYITQSEFQLSGKYFGIASRYYSRASEICSEFLEQRLYIALSKITLASQYESKGNELYKRKDEPLKASKVFLEARDIVDEALGLLATIQNEYLIKSMTAQRAYYEALAKQTEGIHLFDKEEFQTALEVFKESLNKYNEATNVATENKLDTLLVFINRSKSEVEGYISMTKAML